MTFQEVENLRLTYNELQQTYTKRIKKVIVICLGLVGVSFLAILLTILGTKNSIEQEVTSINAVKVTSGITIGTFFSVASCLAIFAVIFFFLFKGRGLAHQTAEAFKAYKKAYKAYFVGTSLPRVFTDYEYNHQLGIEKSLLKSTDLIYTGNIYETNDYVSGKYHNLNFTQADVKIVEVSTDSDGDTTYTTLFYGRWMIFKLTKQFEKHVIVAGKRFGAALNSKAASKYHKITLESKEFNQKFYVFAESETEARYLLDPAFMERVQALSERYNDAILLMIVNNELHIAINDNKDSFEPPKDCRTPLNEKAEFDQTLAEIHTVTDIVDALKLK